MRACANRYEAKGSGFLLKEPAAFIVTTTFYNLLFTDIVYSEGVMPVAFLK